MEAKRHLESIIQRYSGNCSLVVLDGEGKEYIAIDSERVYHAASLIKLPIMLDLLYGFDNNAIDLSEALMVTEAEKVGGCGILSLMNEGHCFTVLELIKLMICVSDNTATNMLIERFGIASVNQMLLRLHAKDTHLARKLMVENSDVFSYTTAGDMACLLSHFCRTGLLNLKTVKLGKDILLEQQYNDRLSKRWPQSSSPIFAHKTGEIQGVVHDAGFFYVGDKAYIVACLTDALTSNEDGYMLLNDVGEYIYYWAINGGDQDADARA